MAEKVGGKEKSGEKNVLRNCVLSLLDVTNQILWPPGWP